MTVQLKQLGRKLWYVASYSNVDMIIENHHYTAEEEAAEESCIDGSCLAAS